MRATRLSILAAACVLPLLRHAQAQTPTVQQIVDLYVSASIARGFEPGIEIAMVIGSAAPRYFSYGQFNAVTQQSGDQSWAFQIGSVTKVFTSNLLAQGAAPNGGGLSRTATLGSLSTQPGGMPLDTNTQAITLPQRANFSAVLPRLPPLCSESGGTPATTGCGKDGRVTGFATQVLLMPGHDAGIVVLTNSTYGNATMLASQIMFALEAAGLLGE